MRINYNVTGADRKALVRAMVEFLGEPPVYQGAPSFAYAVGGCRVDKDGMVSVPDDASSEDIRKLVDALREKGFQPVEPAEQPTAAADSNLAQADDEDLRFLIIKVPRDGFIPETEENLRRIIASKEVAWQNPSRRESWSEEMKQTARERQLRIIERRRKDDGTD